jgi:hypothetical protein
VSSVEIASVEWSATRADVKRAARLASLLFGTTPAADESDSDAARAPGTSASGSGSAGANSEGEG